MDVRRHVKAGFSLVEITLALLIAAVGMLAIYSLFPAGLQMSKSTADEVYAEEFADITFSGYQSLAVTLATNQASWLAFPSANVKPAASSNFMWDNPNGPPGYPTNLCPIADNVMHTNTYSKYGVTYHELRYKLRIAPVLGHADIKYLRLVVWPGRYGTTNENDASVFYSEIFNSQMR